MCAHIPPLVPAIRARRWSAIRFRGVGCLQLGPLWSVDFLVGSVVQLFRDSVLVGKARQTFFASICSSNLKDIGLSDELASFSCLPILDSAVG